MLTGTVWEHLRTILPEDSGSMQPHVGYPDAHFQEETVGRSVKVALKQFFETRHPQGCFSEAAVEHRKKQLVEGLGTGKITMVEACPLGALRVAEESLTPPTHI